MNVDDLDIFGAINKREFVPYFQPLVDLRSGTVHGFEILARWPHPQHGLIPPIDFIERLEHHGLMNGLTVSLLTRAFAALKQLPESIGLSLNISPLQLHDPDLPNLLTGLAIEAGFDLRRLTVEVTESALFRDLGRACAVAAELKRRGMRLSLDDFGTGYSSLLHLQALPFDELKVDASFVRSMSSNRQSRKITASVVSLGQSLGLRTVGEGVEELAQAEMLIWQGCDIGQGWLYGRPMPAEYLPSFMLQQVSFTDIVHIPSIDRKDVALALEAHPADRLPQLRALYDGAPVGLAFLDRDLRYVNINQRLAEMHELPIEAHIGRTVKEVMPETYSQLEPHLRRALAGQVGSGIKVVKFSAIHNAPPSDLFVSYHPAFDEAGEVIGISSSVLDVSVTLPFIRSARQPVTGSQSARLFPSLPWTVDPQSMISKASAALHRFSTAYRTHPSPAPPNNLA